MFSSWSFLVGGTALLLAVSTVQGNTLDESSPTHLAFKSDAARALAATTCSYEPTMFNLESSMSFDTPPVEILSQDVTTVTFSVSQTWSDDLICLVSTYYESADEDAYVCPGEDNVPPGLIDTHTAKCGENGIAEISLLVYDISNADNCNGISNFPTQCESREASKTHKYNFALPCRPDVEDECPEIPDPLCADIRGYLSYEDFEHVIANEGGGYTSPEAETWTYGFYTGDPSGNNYLALGGQPIIPGPTTEYIETSKTFKIPSDAPSVTFSFTLIQLDSWDAESEMYIHVGEYYFHIHDNVFTLAIGDSVTTYFAEAEATFTRENTLSITGSIVIPAAFFPEGLLDVGFRSEDMAVGLDDIAMDLPCASDESNLTCEEQNPCVKFTITKQLSGCGAECDYRICMQLDLSNPFCLAMDTSADHTCLKPDGASGECGLPGFATSTPADNEPDGAIQCQTVPAGAAAEFLLRDGPGIGSCGTSSKFFQDGNQALCSTYTGTDSCYGNAYAGGECYWTVPAPAGCNHNGGGGGDPHIRRWNRKRYSFHGECDLVMVHSDQFHDGAGLDLHIRTTINDWFSFIEAAALRVGDHTLEMHMDKMFVDGVEHDDTSLPMTLGKGKFQYTIQAPIQNPVTKTEGSKLYTVHLQDDSTVTFKIYASFITIAVSGHRNDFGDSVGLMGDFDNGKMFDRAGVRLYDTELFSHEWQVRPDLGEPLLFQETREPQAPKQGCRMPLSTGRAHRRMRATNTKLYKAAIGACSHTNEEDIDLCIDDVMVTGDVGIASAW